MFTCLVRALLLREILGIQVGRVSEIIEGRSAYSHVYVKHHAAEALQPLGFYNRAEQAELAGPYLNLPVASDYFQ